MDWLDRPEWRLAVALGIGLIIGTERERRKGDGITRAPAGVRTHILVALLGGIAVLLGTEALILTGAFVAGIALLGYALTDRSDPGITSEVALFFTFALGALAQREPGIAFGTGVIGATLLALRTPIHTIVRDVLTEQELREALVFAVAAAVVLPLVPDREIDPLGVVNPFTLWRLTVVVMAITAAGYLAQRLIGGRYGLALSGFASGFVSSTATIAAMGSRARTDPDQLNPAVAGASASNVATFILLTVLIGSINLRLLERLAWPLALGGLAAGAYAVAQTRRAARTNLPAPAGRAFGFGSALFFAALVTLVAVASRLIEGWLGEGGAVLAAGLAGLADAHAAAASAASLEAQGKLSSMNGALGVLVALSVNTLSKVLVAFAPGSAAFSRRVAIGLGVMLAGVWLGFTISTLVSS